MKIFFFFTFLHPTAPRNRNNYHLPSFRNSDLKCPKMPLSTLKFHFLQITFFPPLLRAHIHLPKHTPFFLPIMPKNVPNTFYLKLLFFPSLLLLLIPETLPNHLFRETNDQKRSKKLPKRTKIYFLFFFKLFHIFLLRLRKKTKPLSFSALFVTGNKKTSRENVP